MAGAGGSRMGCRRLEWMGRRTDKGRDDESEEQEELEENAVKVNHEKTRPVLLPLCKEEQPVVVSSLPHSFAVRTSDKSLTFSPGWCGISTSTLPSISLQVRTQNRSP